MKLFACQSKGNFQKCVTIWSLELRPGEKKFTLSSPFQDRLKAKAPYEQTFGNESWKNFKCTKLNRNALRDREKCERERHMALVN